MKRRNPIIAKCAICNKEFKSWLCKKEKNEGNFCSKKCNGKWQSIKNFRGVKKVAEGYVLIYCPAHPFARHDGYIKRSRMIMEVNLGRILTRGEKVHHLNGKKDDDRIENLMKCESESEHQIIHRKKK